MEKEKIEIKLKSEKGKTYKSTYTREIGGK